ncbi:ArsR/SmtB family transcription factor [Kineococcus esterisolvens]|uniref:ArsR/SmtB family transcription factor n=1 Tax=unclassified Kineococcus TaxID=2621656 RepID=UPI003D7C7EAA
MAESAEGQEPTVSDKLDEVLALLRAGAGGARAGLDGERFWALEGLRGRVGEDGGVLMTGTVRLPGDLTYEWQQGSTTEALLEADWSARAGALDALAHPVRLLLVQHVLRGTTSTGDLSRLEGVGTTGQLHHHLRQLVAAGWLRSTGRGRYEVPAPRVVPLLVLLLAAER